MTQPRTLLLIVARAPEAGCCKTRLGATIGMERAAALYAAFLVDMAARFTALGGTRGRGFEVGWAYTPATCDFPKLLRDLGSAPFAPGTRFVPQEGDDFAIRQANLLRWGAAQGYAATALLASDSPHYAPAAVEEAFVTLREHDVVLARTLDGGYSLIGMRGYHDLLAGVPMSTTSVADDLAVRATSLGLRLADLPVTFDVDEEADLALLYEALSPAGLAAPATWKAMARLGLAPTRALTPTHSRARERV